MIWEFTKRIGTNVAKQFVSWGKMIEMGSTRTAKPLGEDTTVRDLLDRGLPWIIFPMHHDDYRTVVVFENHPYRFSGAAEEMGVELPEHLIEVAQPSYEAWSEAVDVARKWCKNRLEIDDEEFDHIVESSMAAAFSEKLLP